MPHRKKILIAERDDFLREIIGNLLHKKGFYVLNGLCIEDAIQESKGHKIDTIILGTSCRDYKNKKSIQYIKKNIAINNFYILNDSEKELDFVPADMQMKISELSIQKIIDRFTL